MKKTLLLFVMALLATHFAMAGRIDESEAYKIAASFFNGSGNGRKLAPATGNDATLSLAQSGKAYFAFNRGKSSGFVIVAADDNAAADVLGFADSGTFRADSMPEAMRWWLDEYARQMDYAASQPATGNRVRAALGSYADIAPMLSSTWDQNEPYNALCPTYQGTQCPTGCVATALAQIMYFYKWPEHGTGSHSYDWTVGGRFMETLSADFSQSTYDWAAMTDSYNDASTQEAKDAVAKLMFDIGVAAEMSYGPTGSGAQSTKGIKSMVDYFGYDISTTLLQRDYYSIAEWQQMIYNSLADGRPVFYSGTTASNEGHAFVCDGYSNGYFHINWGWSGTSNGYFLLSALDPSVQGTGGSNAGYNYRQMAAPGLRPSEGTADATPLMYCTEGFDVMPKSASRQMQVMFSGGFYNFGTQTRHLTLGIKVTDTEGNATYIASGFSDELEMQIGYSSFTMTLAGFPTAQGQYRVTPAYRDEVTSTWYDMLTPVTSDQRYLLAEVTASGINFSNPETAGSKISATGLATASTPYAARPFLVNATITNNGAAEYYDEVAVAILRPGTMEAVATSVPVLIALTSGASTTLNFNVTAPSATGSYELAVISADGEIVSERLPITVNSAPSGTLSLSLPTQPTMDYSGPVAADDIRFTAQIECQSGFYANKLYAVFFPAEGGNSICNLAADLYVAAGETRTVHFSGSLPNATVGSDYAILLYYLSDNTLTRLQSDNNKLVFTIGSLTPISEINTDAQPHDIEVYSLSGNLLLRQKAAEADLSTLAAGTYIVKENGKTRKVIHRQ